ncbi:MAG: electron transfer flavoprotein subunit beta/FixA family protein [Desulfatirhabdiaceae bacterium]
MNIIVLLKQAPSTDSLIEPAADGVSIKTTDIKYIINPYDEFALEEALRIRDTKGGIVTILSVGEQKASEAIRTGLAMGADKGILIQDPACFGMTGLGIAKILSAVIKTLPHDLIIAGQRAVDDENWLVGVAVSEYLQIPCISLVIHQETEENMIRCTRTIDGGTMTIEARLPALITTQRGLNEPRYASLQGVMKAKKKPIDVKTLADLGLDAATIGTVNIQTLSLKQPPQRKGGRFIDGSSPQAKAAELVRLLHEEARVI